MNIYQKLQTARVELQNRHLKKSGKNAFAGFDYFELSDFLPSVNEIFCKLGLHSKFEIVEGTATLTIINTEAPEEVETFSSPIAEAQIKGCTPIQALGGIHTYMRRYLYVNALEISDGDLFDAVVKKPEKVENTAKIENPDPVKPETLEECKAWKIDVNKVATYFKIPVEDLTNNQVLACIDKKKKAEAKKNG